MQRGDIGRSGFGWSGVDERRRVQNKVREVREAESKSQWIIKRALHFPDQNWKPLKGNLCFHSDFRVQNRLRS